MEKPILTQLRNPAPCGHFLPPYFWPRVTPPLPKRTSPSQAVSLLLSPPSTGTSVSVTSCGLCPDSPVIWDSPLCVSPGGLSWPSPASAISTSPASWLHLWDTVHRPAVPTAGHGTRPRGPQKPVKSERAAWKHVYYHMWNRSPV